MEENEDWRLDIEGSVLGGWEVLRKGGLIWIVNVGRALGDEEMACDGGRNRKKRG